MALLPNGYNPKNLEDVIKQAGTQQQAGLTDQYTQSKKKAINQQAASGRLGSGVANYPLTDLDTSYQSSLSGIQQGTASKLAAVPEEDFMAQQGFGRNYQLSKLLAGMNKPSTLEEILGGVGQVGSMAAMVAPFL